MKTASATDILRCDSVIPESRVELVIKLGLVPDDVVVDFALLCEAETARRHGEQPRQRLAWSMQELYDMVLHDARTEVDFFLRLSDHGGHDCADWQVERLLDYIDGRVSPPEIFTRIANGWEVAEEA